MRQAAQQTHANFLSRLNYFFENKRAKLLWLMFIGELG